MDAPILVAVMGPTASGKTSLAEALADRLEAPLVNADAFQIYRGLDVGTSKPVAKARYELIDIRDPDEGFGVGEWVQAALEILNANWQDRRNVVIVGGTGLYVRALLEQYADMKPPPTAELRTEVRNMWETEGAAGLAKRLWQIDPAAASKVDPRNPARLTRALEKALCTDEPMKVVLPPFRSIKLGLDPPSEHLQDRIERRLTEMMQNGWVREVESLQLAGYRKEDPAMRAIGYLDVWDHIEGRLSLEGAVSRIVTATRQYAKRQRTWLRGEPNLIRLSNAGETDAIVAEAMDRI
jgi:tRNA dimethylallyltransferase